MERIDSCLARAQAAIAMKDNLLYCAIYGCFLLAHACYLIVANGGIWISSDSGVFYESSRLPITDIQLWAGPRPPAGPLFFKLFGGYEYEVWDWSSTWPAHIEDPSLTYSQTIFSIIAFTFLATVCKKTATTKSGRITLFSLPLLFGVVPLVARWNIIAHSESFSVSVFIVFLGTWIMFLSTKRLGWIVAIGIVALVWSAIRDTNAYVLIMIACTVAIVLVVAAIKDRAIPLLGLCAFFVLSFVLSDLSAEHSGRWKGPFYNVIGKRVLPVSEYRTFFADLGMPMSRALMDRSGRFASDDDWAFHRDADLEGFRAWTAKGGKAAYVEFLVRHMTYSITAPAAEFQELFLEGIGDVVGLNSEAMGDKVALTRWFSNAMSYAALACFVLVLGVTPILWRLKVLNARPHLLVPLAMILLSLPHAWLVWHGDAMGIVRHSLTALIQFSLGLLLLCGFMYEMRSSNASGGGRARLPGGSGKDRHERIAVHGA